MTGLIIKIIVYPTVVSIAGVFPGQINYAAVYQPILTGLVLAVAAHIMDIYLLKPETIWFSTAMDFIASSTIVYISGLVFTGAAVSLAGALTTGLVLAATEIPQHYWLATTGKLLKSPKQPAE